MIHYLNSLTPVPISEGPFAVVAEPTPAWICNSEYVGSDAPGADYRRLPIRHMEIRYVND